MRVCGKGREGKDWREGWSVYVRHAGRSRAKVDDGGRMMYKVDKYP